MPLNHSPLNRCGVRDSTESDAVDLSQFYIVDEATNASPILPYIPNALRRRRLHGGDRLTAQNEWERHRYFRPTGV